MSFIKNIASKYIQEAYDKGIKQGKKEEFEKTNEFKETAKKIFYEHGAFIGISNEWQKMDIFEIVSFPFGNEITEVKSLIDGEIYINFSPLVPYSEGMVKILKKLNPYERYDLVTQTRHCLSNGGKDIITSEEDKSHYKYEETEEKMIEAGNEFMVKFKK